MRITDTMLVPEGTKDEDADVRRCKKCGGNAFFVPQKVLVFTRGGARTMRLWACEEHPLPQSITDQPDEGEQA